MLRDYLDTSQTMSWSNIEVIVHDPMAHPYDRGPWHRRIQPAIIPLTQW